jgi:ABC-type transporter Mla subunit MlaD
LAVAPLAAQLDTKQDPLTPDQQEQIAEAGIDPVARVDLFVKFLDERTDIIRSLIKRAKSPARSQRLAGDLHQFGALMDELGDNLDVYSQRNADLRKSLKSLNEGVQRWQGILHDLPSEPGFDLSLKDALASVKDLASQTKQLTTDQEAYFNAHPDQKGQDRSEPQ